MAERSYERILEIAREIGHLESIAKLLNWDQHTNLPKAAAAARADQRTYVARRSHELRSSDELQSLLEELVDSPKLKSIGPVAEANIREMHRDHSRERRIPARLVSELSQTIGLAREPWLEARTTNRFELFAPWLEKLVALSRERAQALDSEDEPYDALLEDFEPGLRSRDLFPVLHELQGTLRKLTDTLLQSSSRPDTSVLHRKFEARKLASFARRFAAAVGFDFDAGRMDESSHSFCAGVHASDVRLVTGYNESNPLDSLFATIHEVGHGLYHQGIGNDQWGTPIGRGASLGVHESQARWWENCLARGAACWRFFFPQLQADFPMSLRDSSPDRFYAAINNVCPSLIRVEADEVTYNLHIVMRAELERDLIKGDMSVDDLPNAWDDAMENTVGVRPANHGEGVLQDVHWSQAMFGYFPTYAIGNLYAAQLNQRLRQDIPDLDEQIERGNFANALEWMRTRIHRHGAFFQPGELISRACGKTLSAKPLIQYLTDKFLPLYGM